VQHAFYHLKVPVSRVAEIFIGPDIGFDDRAVIIDLVSRAADVAEKSASPWAS
jgi:hypothetical protein